MEKLSIHYAFLLQIVSDDEYLPNAKNQKKEIYFHEMFHQ